VNSRKQQLQATQKELIAAGFIIDKVVDLKGNNFGIFATCKGLR
jgi:hypothetical protein